ncbi:hypothetical protein [Clostridium perfringens]|uniref:Uncharacterized protein n=4 Tax=Clostridium perfringens TaxID=1502 RepID=A0AAN5NBD5_CLOPF|nr:hypothetical protein [Clostridium perfringens]ALG48647.1 hypothetical protein FORC3_1270 [Clostridium perfringens]AQW26621.1 hypothetical protein BXT94_07530 [Clostridium perfringens]EJT6533128.1 hypothetical protein [Clostridium perfringens]ELC8363333.1 hypothetical protein [Clostridium perfringens]KAB8118592.1 hypothetical protein FVB38_16040 [Clostridium perfringens]
MDKIKKILYPIIVIVQAILWIGVIAIQYLTNKKAGVMHHVYFRKYQYSNSISIENLNILSIIALIISLVFFIWFIYSIKAKKSGFYKIQTIITSIMAIILILVIKLTFFQNLLAYYYFIMIGIIVLVIQILWNVIIAIKYK